MYRKTIMALMTAILITLVSACGSDKAEQVNAPEEEPAEVVQGISDTEETAAVDIADKSPVIADAEDKSSDLYEIYQDGSNYVHFVFHAALAEGTDVKEVVYTVGNYEVAFLIITMIPSVMCWKRATAYQM